MTHICHCRFLVQLDLFVVSETTTRSLCCILARIVGFNGFSDDTGASSKYRATEMVRNLNSFLFYMFCTIF